MSDTIDDFVSYKNTPSSQTGIKGFLFQTGEKLATNVASQKASGGQQAPAYQVPMPKAMGLSTTSGVRAGQFNPTNSQFRMPGVDDSRVRQKIASALNSNSNLIRVQLEVVGVKTQQGRRTRSLEEATLGKKKT